jgi:ATP-binding cassette subfamily B protein
VAQGLFNTVVDTIILWITVQWRPKWEFSLERFRGLYSFGWKLLVSSLIDTCYNNLRQLIIGNSRHMEMYLRQKLFAKFQQLPASFFDEHPTGDLMAMAINDINAVRMTMGMVVAQVLTGVSTAIFSLYHMIQNVHTSLAMYALIPIPFAVFSVVFLGIRVRRQFAKVQKMYARISGTIQENIMGQRVLKAFHREENAQRTVEEKSAEMRDANIRLNDMSALINPLIQVCFGVSFLISLTYGSNLVLNSTITVGELVSFNEYLTRIMRPVVSLGRIINATARGMASYRRLRDIIQQPEISPMEYEYKDMELTGAVSVRNLSYTYPGTTRQVLKDVSFELPVGKVIGVVGETGCGKTTLIDLLLKLRTAPDDTVFLDGHPLQTVPARTVRSIIGYVPQEEFLFNTTVRENIRFYEPATEPALQEASRAADLAKDMAQLAEGMDTEVGERGRHLSGGQKKRVTIARALVRDPKLLIFDDVLSSVDVRTEREILENLRQIMAEKTCLIVSQRISALRHADEILYMEHGTIAERGTHEELLALGGRYAALHEQQAKAAEEAEAALRQ